MHLVQQLVCAVRHELLGIFHSRHRREKLILSRVDLVAVLSLPDAEIGRHIHTQCFAPAPHGLHHPVGFAWKGAVVQLGEAGSAEEALYRAA